MNKNVTVSLKVDVEYLMGHLRYGYYKGNVTLTPEELKMLKTNPKEAVKTLDLISYLDFVIEDFSIDAIGDISEVKIKELYNESNSCGN